MLPAAGDRRSRENFHLLKACHHKIIFFPVKKLPRLTGLRSVWWRENQEE
jgi:hypothetical protein